MAMKEDGLRDPTPSTALIVWDNLPPYADLAMRVLELRTHEAIKRSLGAKKSARERAQMRANLEKWDKGAFFNWAVVGLYLGKCRGGKTHKDTLLLEGTKIAIGIAFRAGMNYARGFGLLGGADQQTLLDQIQLRALELPTALRVAIRKTGISTIGQLVLSTEDELLRMRGIGPGSVARVKARLQEVGLALAADCRPRREVRSPAKGKGKA